MKPFVWNHSTFHLGTEAKQFPDQHLWKAMFSFGIFKAVSISFVFF